MPGAGVRAGETLESPSDSRIDPVEHGESANVDAAQRQSASSVSKALVLLGSFARAERGILGVSDLARLSGLPKATSHRLLKVLETHGFVERRSSKYSLGWRFFELGQTVRWSAYGELREAAVPLLEELFERVRETVHLAVLEGDEVLYLEKICAPGGSRIPSKVGGRMPAYCTALGKAMLAFCPREAVDRMLTQAGLRKLTGHTITAPQLLRQQLQATRAEGVSYDIEESRLGVTCAAAPILDAEGFPFGAVSVAGPTFRFSPRKAAPLLLQTVGQIAKRMTALRTDVPPFRVTT